MKKIIPFILLLVFTGLCYLNNILAKWKYNPEHQNITSPVSSPNDPEMSYYSEKFYIRKSGSKVKIKIHLFSENQKYSNRIFNSAVEALSFLDEHIGQYPYKELTIFNRRKNSISRQLPSVVSFEAKVFSSASVNQPERDIMEGVCRQYFYYAMMPQNRTDTLLCSALTNYTSDKIVFRYCSPEKISFNLFGYYPINGLNFLSYNEIPLIYSLGDYYYPEGSHELENYYCRPEMYLVSDTINGGRYYNEYIKTVTSKSVLMFYCLERYEGTDYVMHALRNYYRMNSFRKMDLEKFRKSFSGLKNFRAAKLVDMYLSKKEISDYSIREVVRTGDNTYEVYAERLGGASFIQDVCLYTDKDTLSQKWNGLERWKKLVFKTNAHVVGAEIDPYRKNIIDINYSNNSYIINKQYGGAVGLSLRWFFWMQNLLLILGSTA
jgi:hypothetical protein